MIDGALLDKLEEIARRIRGSNQPFGGIQLIFSGDFFQLPPVNRHQITVLAFEAKCWKRIINKNMVLTTCFRQKDQSKQS
ncbi:uncharacterized protein BX663DRAFT_103583 [Cokeromyces recurvatus]|uniref:uncharacterized protein n=1 Tax=Cokeromyces recurvatus TaxID=90255 RepID=UPI00221F2D22|nr:uncharacterized protein BX663DRAFT_103583 [Cokeromyces recurvatus]KAI7901752.1 hypothetical protein BX663DRAFT_103583 [Cokeromyces recurvatus]